MELRLAPLHPSLPCPQMHVLPGPAPVNSTLIAPFEKNLRAHPTYGRSKRFFWAFKAVFSSAAADQADPALAAESSLCAAARMNA
jgi:hypothetical protein